MIWAAAQNEQTAFQLVVAQTHVPNHSANDIQECMDIFCLFLPLTVQPIIEKMYFLGDNQPDVHFVCHLDGN